MSAYEPFTLIEESAPTRLFDTFQDLTSAKTADHDIQLLAALRKAFPDHVVTAVPTGNCNILAFAEAGNAAVELDLETDSYASWRGWIPSLRAGQNGSLGETVFFVKHNLQWESEAFVVYTIRDIQYILAKRAPGETSFSHSASTDALIAATGTWQYADQNVVWVFDTSSWMRNKELSRQVQKADWKNVILDEDMKKTLTELSTKFFDSRDVYAELGVPWKRGIIFHGPAGNGKTISIKALMHTLLSKDEPVPTLYVKAAPQTWSIRLVFQFARKMAPCLLVFEDIDTVVNDITRSYFFNECDGLENNDGILMVASTNHLDRLDPGITKRPSRFDRKYLFPLPSEHERTLYCDFWRHKLQKSNSHIAFPEKLSPAIASITADFSFAYLQEAFVAALLAIARDDAGEEKEEDRVSGSNKGRRKDGDDDLKKYPLWVIIKEQIAMLRGDMDTSTTTDTTITANPIPSPAAVVERGTQLQAPVEMPDMTTMRLDAGAGAGNLPLSLMGDESAGSSSATRQLQDRKYRLVNTAAFEWRWSG